MLKKIDDELKARAVRLVNDHQGEYSSLTAAAAVVAKQLGIGKESVRRWVIQSQVDGGGRQGTTSEKLRSRRAHGSSRRTGTRSDRSEPAYVFPLVRALSRRTGKTSAVRISTKMPAAAPSHAKCVERGWRTNMVYPTATRVTINRARAGGQTRRRAITSAKAGTQ